MELEKVHKQLVEQGMEIELQQVKRIVGDMNAIGVMKSIQDRPDWVMQFIKLALDLGLNPLRKEIYAVRFRDNFSIIIDYHQYIRHASASPNYQGYSAIFVDKDETGAPLKDGDKYVLFSCKPLNWDREYCMKYKMCEWNKKQGEWMTKPEFMLQKTAIKNGLAHCFPERLGTFDAIEQSYIAEQKIQDASVLPVDIKSIVGVDNE